MADLIPQADLSLPAEARSPVTGAAQVQDDWVRASFAAVYPVIRRLGTGASGAVFLARDNTLHRMVALKVLAPELARDPAVLERFRQEARVNARLCHPNIVPIHAIGDRAGTAYVVMRFVPGDSLAQHVWRGERWPVDQVARVLADVAAALDYAHREQVVHRDVKPENILLDNSTGAAMLADFGIARGTSLNAMRSDQMRAERELLWGTPHFMAPEQADGTLDVDGRADLYALGVTGFALLAGRLPFEGTSVRNLLARHTSTAPPDLSALADSAARHLVPIIMRCLAKHPDDRWSDGRALRTAILQAGGAPAPSRRSRSWWRRLRRPV